MLELAEFGSDLASALKCLDATRPVETGKRFRPGVGPFTEREMLNRSLEYLKQSKPEVYSFARPRDRYDLVLPGAWIVEVKLLRPFGDNEKEAEHWSEQLLHPYAGNTSAIGDCLKLLNSDRKERKAIVVIAFQHAQPKFDLDIVLRAFELIATEILGVELSERLTCDFRDLVHPCHQHGIVFAWEVCGAKREKLLDRLKAVLTPVQIEEVVHRFKRE